MRQKVVWWLPEAGERGKQGVTDNGGAISLWDDGNALKLDCGSCCITKYSKKVEFLWYANYISIKPLETLMLLNPQLFINYAKHRVSYFTKDTKMQTPFF